jgi:hypothetical protein
METALAKFMSPRYPVFVLPVLSVVFASLAQEVRTPIENPGFEHGKPGEVPPGWDNGGGYAGYPAEISNDNPNSGRQCGLLRTDPQSRVRDYGVLSQMIEIAPFRKRAIHLGIFARATTDAEGWAAVFYRVDRSGDQKPLFANRRITSKDWRRYDLDVEIPDDAIRMQFGITLSGDGRVWVDDASVEVAGKASQ